MICYEDDMLYPEKLPDFHNNLPFLPEMKKLEKLKHLQPNKNMLYT